MVVHPTHAEFDSIIEEILGQRLPGRPKQEPFVESEFKNYQLGSRLRFGKTTWHYCQAGPVGQSSLGRGMGSLVVPENWNTVGATAVGSHTVVIADTTLAHGIDYWANGKIEFWTPVATPQHRVIRSSTASNGTSVTLTLYYPIAILIPTGGGTEICRSGYAQVDSVTGHAHQATMSIVGIPYVDITAEYFFWAMTWGICTVNAGSQANLGVAGRSRTAYFHADGTIISHEDVQFVDGCQVAGYLIPDSDSGHQTVIMLQLDP